MTDAEKSAIYTDFYGKVLGYLTKKVSDRDLAEDLASDVFLKVYEKLDTFDAKKASLSTWIYTITQNRLKDYYRTRRVFEEVPEELEEETDSVEDTVCNEEMLGILADALESLNERERDLIILRYYSGVPLKEIADRLGISYTYAKVLQSKALAAMKKFF